MNPLDIALSFLALLTGIGALSAGLGICIAQVKTAYSKENLKSKDDLIDTLNETIVAEKGRAERLADEKLALDIRNSKQINDLNREIGELKGLYQASELSKKEYLAILQGRSPEQIKFMTEVLSILEEIRRFMNDINSKQARTEVFQQSVTTATEAGIGKVLRKEDSGTIS
jgi:hypothetical protein